jgi:hypothetical protein
MMLDCLVRSRIGAIGCNAERTATGPIVLEIAASIHRKSLIMSRAAT